MADPIFESDLNGAAVIADVTTAAPAGLGWDNPSQEVGAGACTLEETVIPRVGTKSIKCVAPAYDGATVAKAALQKAGFTFSAYTEAWIEWQLYIKAATSYHMLGLLDLEDVDHPNGLAPGRMLYVGRDLMLHSALLRCGANSVNDQDVQKPMPVDQWVKMRAYFFFDPDGLNGRVKIWRDDVLILDGTGITMPNGGYVTDRIQLGITNHQALCEQTVYIADVKVWNVEPVDGLSPGGGGKRKDLPIPVEG